MARKRRYYTDDDFEVGASPSVLKRFGRERQKDYMRHWFYRMFEDPAEQTPYNSAEGGYLYIWGGPYDAREELYDEFGSIVPEDRIEEVVAEVEADGIVDWAPGPAHPDHERAREDWDAERAPDKVSDEPEDIDEIITRLEAGLRPSYGDPYELKQRREILEKLGDLKAALMRVAPSHGGIGHNHPPPDEDSPQAVIVYDAEQAREVIERELVKPEPNALEVAKAASTLQEFADWMAKKADVAAENFAKEFGATTGKVAGRVVSVGIGVAAALTLPPLGIFILDVVRQVSNWLSHVTLPF